MARILITSGPTRQYLDPVRYLTNASSGRMGAALARAALEQGHQVVIVSGPVSIDYPEAAELHWVVTTDEMLSACRELFPGCDGLIGVAAPCDYRPLQVEDQKIAKTGQPLTLQLLETPDVVATVAQNKLPEQWVVGFALETEDRHFRAITKMQQKCCDLMVLNGTQAIDAENTDLEILDPAGRVVAHYQGSKTDVAQRIVYHIERSLVDHRESSRDARRQGGKDIRRQGR